MCLFYFHCLESIAFLFSYAFIKNFDTGLQSATVIQYLNLSSSVRWCMLILVKSSFLRILSIFAMVFDSFINDTCIYTKLFISFFLFV